MSQIVIFERLRNVVDKHDIERNFALMRQRSNIRRSVDGTCRAKTGVNVMGSISRRVRSPRTSCAHGSDWSRRSVLMQSVRSERVGKTCARIGGGYRLARPNRVFRHRSSGRTCPPAHLDSFASVTALPHLPSPNTFIEAHSAPPKKSHADPRIKSSQ
ncbi:conserved hypothetical protein [Burkholderia pseudomallei Pakistan 9]|nr:conserved hypothetical protein [Burkholderia pseudomallei Pakistan 9]